MDKRLQQLPPDTFPPGFIDNLPPQANVPESVPKLKFGLKDFRPKSNVFKRLLNIITPLSVYFWILLFLIVVGILINKYIINHWFTNLIYSIICLVILFN